MRSSKGKLFLLGRLARTKPSLLTALFASFLFFLAGFYSSMLLYQDVSAVCGGRRSRLSQTGVDGGPAFTTMPHGKTGESTLSRVPFQVLSWKPRAVFFPEFATAEQCESIIRMAKSKLRPSKLALRKGETEENTKGTRTSSGTFLSASQDSTGVLSQIEQKIAKVTMIPRDHDEDFNILHYGIGQRYDSHYDAFNPAEYGPQRSQRVASFLLYLSTVEEGGETMFPFEDGSNMGIGYNYQECIGLKVKPRQGDGLLFYSLMINGTIDPMSLHGSCPVIEGEKWVATKWIRDQIEK